MWWNNRQREGHGQTKWGIVACTRLKILQGESISLADNKLFQSTRQSVHQFTHRSVHQWFSLPVRPSISLPIHLSISPSVGPSISLLVCGSLSSYKCDNLYLWSCRRVRLCVWGGRYREWGCSPLPTHPLFCDPVTLFYVVCRHFYLIVSSYW